MWTVGLGVLVAMSGCSKTYLGSGDDDDDAFVDPTGTPPSTTDPVTSTPEPVRPLVSDLEIAKVSLFQGVEAVLVENGKVPNALQMPVIIGRPGLLRVFVAPNGSWTPRKVTGILTVTSTDGTTVLESTLRVDEASRPDESTTINFDLDGALLKRTTEFHLELVEETPDGPGGGLEQDVVWDSDALGGLDADNTDELQIVLVPVRYNADGSGRLPDTSPQQVQRIEDLAMGVYPATSVTVRVDPPFDWDEPIGAFNGNQWGDILSAINALRDRANEAPNTYYYGMFVPEPTIAAFCNQGCILGLSLLAFTAQDPYFRASVGIGYTGDYTSETIVHEFGHAHGRSHADCGGASGTDPQYPYPGAKIGVWGNSVVTGEVFGPQDTVDMMSYCTPIWVSDYTFYALYERMNTVAGQNRRIAPTPRTALRVLDDGSSVSAGTMSLADTAGAPRVDIRVFDASGVSQGQTTAAFFPYDHVAGGFVALDEQLPEGWTAEVVSP
ncbi:MAG: hypothetical protein ABMB14_27935 [Myxococcota bacterium]